MSVRAIFKRALGPRNANRGEWYLLERHGGAPAVYVVCPGCGMHGSLDDHQVLSDGKIEPSLDCPECDFHQYGILEDWRAQSNH